jgi:hypothetical protein
MAGCAVLSVALLTPLHALETEHFISRHLAQLPAASTGIPRVIFLNPKQGYYAWDLIQNDPFLREPVLKFVMRNDEADRAMMAAVFPDLELLTSGPSGSVWGLPERR